MSELSSTKDLKRTLGFWDLMGASIGQIIGAGVMSLTGIAIGMTGRSTPVAFLLSAFLMLIATYPVALIMSAGRFRGGAYSIIGTLLGEKWTGMYTIIFIMANISLSMYCLSFADYAMPFLPMVPRKLIAAGVLVILYVLNMFGIDKFSKFQNTIVVVLILALTTFSVFGITRLDGNYFDESFMTNGVVGLLTATAQLSFATGGASIIANFSAESKNPSKDIPKAMIVSTVAVAVLYAFMAVVASGVLPVSEVANQPLTLVAERILPKPLYVFFIIGGAWTALISTLNTQLASCTKPIMQACNDGWLPQGLAKLHKKYKTPVFLLTIMFVVGIVPIVTGLDISLVSRITTILSSVGSIMIIFALPKVKDVLPEGWEKSPLKMSDGKVKLLVVIAAGILIFQGILLAMTLELPFLLGNIAILIFAYVFAQLRYKSGKVNLEISYEAD